MNDILQRIVKLNINDTTYILGDEAATPEQVKAGFQAVNNKFELLYDSLNSFATVDETTDIRNSLTTNFYDREQVDQKLDKLGFLDTALEGTQEVPIGTIISSLDGNARDGYLKCDGTVYNVSEYKQLAEYIETLYGSKNYFGGNGASTFAVPNLAERFLKGVSDNGGTFQNAGVPNVTGDNLWAFRPSAYDSTDNGSFIGVGHEAEHVAGIATDSTVDWNLTKMTFDASESSAVYGDATTVTPANMSVCFFIKARNTPKVTLNIDSESAMPAIAQEVARQIAELNIEQEVSAAQEIPIGTIISTLGIGAKPGYLKCDGAEYNISDYPKLAEFFTAEYGSVNKFGGDGETTFKVPDLNGRFLKGDTAATGVLEAAGLPNIKGENFWVFRPGEFDENDANGALETIGHEAESVMGVGTDDTVDWNLIRAEIDASSSNSVYGDSATVIPDNMSVCFYIKALESTHVAINVDGEVADAAIASKVDAYFFQKNLAEPSKVGVYKGLNVYEYVCEVDIPEALTENWETATLTPSKTISDIISVSGTVCSSDKSTIVPVAYQNSPDMNETYAIAHLSLADTNTVQYHVSSDFYNGKIFLTIRFTSAD